MYETKEVYFFNQKKMVTIGSNRKETISLTFFTDFFAQLPWLPCICRLSYFCHFSCQKAVLNELELGPNIARNTALSENVFMMVVCVELRIPLFVVGKPGSSKSLAKTVVADNMQGDAARSELFKTFKQVATLIWTFKIIKCFRSFVYRRNKPA